MNTLLGLHSVALFCESMNGSLMIYLFLYYRLIQNNCFLAMKLERRFVDERRR